MNCAQPNCSWKTKKETKAGHTGVQGCIHIQDWVFIVWIYGHNEHLASKRPEFPETPYMN